MNSDNEEMSRISGILSKIPKRVTPEDRIAELEAEVARLTVELAAMAQERDRMAAALVTLHELMVEITKDEIECAQSDDGFAVKGWIKVIRLKYQAVDALLENPSAILADVKARAKAEGLREAAEMLDCTINSSAEPVVYAGLISGNAVSDAKLIGLWRQIKERAAQDGGEANG